MCFVVVVVVVVVGVVIVFVLFFNNRASLNRLFDAGISVISFIIYNFGVHRRVISKRMGGLC